jgi:hypothetical protein
MKKWKRWLNETKPTKKYFGDVPRKLSTVSPKNQKYNRAITAAMGQADFRSTLKEFLGQFMKNSKRDGDIEWLASQIKPEDRKQAARDLNILRYIYSGKSKFDIIGTGHFGATGVLYDNQPDVTGSAVDKINFTMEQMSIEVSNEPPSEEEQEEVYIYYVHPNWSLTKAKEIPPEIKATFKKNIAISQQSDFMKRQAELDAINRQREIERKRELAKRRRERRRNK